MTTEELITMATNSRNLGTQSHLLSASYHIPEKEANSLILSRFYDRVHDRGDIQPNKVDWMVTFSRKDVQRSLNNEYHFKAEHVDDGYSMDDITNINHSTNDQYSQLSDEVLEQIFPDTRSREFVKSILSSGKEETMATFNLTKQQFNSRLNHKVKYCHDHSELINRVLNTDERKELIKQQRLIQVLLDDVSNSGIDDQGLNVMIATLFEYYPQLHNWLEDSKEQLRLKYEAMVVNNFVNSGKDGRLFLQYLYQRLDSINEKLEGSNIND